MALLGRLGTLVLVGGVAVVAVGTAPALAEGQGGAPKPGPAVLHAGAVDAPQLRNAGVWKAKPIGICHSSAYRDGEFVHQGCIYDDEGGGNQYRWFFDNVLRNYTYPENPAYRRNAADILEVRVRPLADATAFRVTMNTMTDPELYGLTLALGGSDAPRKVPHGANTVMPATTFVTVHGERGDIVDAGSGRTLDVRPDVSVDLERRQVEIRVPHSVFDPKGTERIAAAAGLWDRGGDGYLVPRVQNDATHPGGAVVGDPSPSAFFDVAFRTDEPFEAPNRNKDSKNAIGRGDLSRFFADVDFAKLARGADDDSKLPTKGYITRLFASEFEKAQGRRLPTDPGGPPPGAGTQQGGIQLGGASGQKGRFSLQFGWPCRDDCVPDLPGRMQRYMIYVPDAPAPKDGYPSMVWTNGYALRPGDDVAGPKDLFRVLAERPDHPTMVIDVDARGNDEWGYGESGAAVFEALADARRHYDLDEERTAMSGFSSGAYMANKLSLSFPDVFGKAFICDGLNVAPSFPGINGVADLLPFDTLTRHEPGSRISSMLPSRRNQPVMEWAGANDDFIPYPITRQRAEAYAKGDYDYEFLTWAGYGSEHLAMCKNGMWKVAADWLGDGKRAVDPPRVTYVRNTLMDDPRSGLVGDHAYWLSGIEAPSGRVGTVDAVTHGLGRAEAAAPAKRIEGGLADGAVTSVNPYLREYRHRPDPVPAAERNALDVTATDITEVTVDPKRAGLDCDADINARTNLDLAVRLLGCDRTERFTGSGAAGANPYNPADPLSGLKLPKGGPLEPELGEDVPQVPGLVPPRFPPNQGDPRPSGR
jgi:predicted esterase